MSEQSDTKLIDKIAFEDGFEAGCREIGYSEPACNPYPKGSAAHAEFESGVQDYRTYHSDWDPHGAE